MDEAAQTELDEDHEPVRGDMAVLGMGAGTVTSCPSGEDIGPLASLGLTALGWSGLAHDLTPIEIRGGLPITRNRRYSVDHPR